MLGNELEEYQILKNFIFDNETQTLMNQINDNVMNFNILEITGMGSQEIKHSNLLAWFFGKNEHNLDHEIFESFLKKVIEINENIEVVELLKYYTYLSDNNKSLTIYREKNNIDLLLVDQVNKVVFAIENKVYAYERTDGEDGGQLKKYYEYINKTYSKEYKKFFIYLTEDNSFPSEDNKEIWLTATHELIGEIIEQYIKNNSLRDKARLIFESYVDLLKRRKLMANKDLEELCEKIWSKNSKALDILYNYRKTDLDNFYTFIREHQEFVFLDDTYIKTSVHDKLSLVFHDVDKWENSEQDTIELLLIKKQNYIWFGYWHPEAKELCETNEKFKSLYVDLFGKKAITKERRIFIISEDDFYDDEYNKVKEKFFEEIKNEINRFEDIVKNTLGLEQ